jgi:outer membrane protein assembly factor BamB
MRIASSLVLTIVAAGAVAAQEWNQWRGPDRTGIASSFTPPPTWPDRPTKVWQVEAGAGHSSPVVSTGRVFLFSRIGGQEAVTAFDVTSGKQIWRQTYDAPYDVNPAATSHGSGPKSTPAVADGRLYTFGIGGILSAFEAASGRVLWREDFRKGFKETAPDFGTAMSPIVVDGLVIVHAGGPDQGAILALDARNGRVRWAWRGDGPAYASPVVGTFGGVRQVITQTQKHLAGVLLSDGSLAWQIPFTTAYEQNIVTPVVHEDTVIYSGIEKPLTAVRIAERDGKWTAEQVWQNPSVPMYMSSPVLVDGVLFGLTHRNRGQFVAVDARTGETRWATRGREAENAAFVAAGDVVLATTTEGELVILRRNPASFDLVKRYTVAESPIWAHPAPAGRGVVIKDADTIAYWMF